MVTLRHVTKSAMARGATWLVCWEAGPAAQFSYTSVFFMFFWFSPVSVTREEDRGEKKFVLVFS